MSERLQKFLARAGVASRRHAEGLITAGRVAVNNQVVTTLGTKVSPGDLVTVDGTLVSPPERSSWYLLHKPPGVVTTLADPEGRPTVAGFLADLPGRVFPVGRLDWDAEGALLFTDDGGSAHRLLHPSFEVPRTYLVKVKGTPTDETLQRLTEGVRLEDGPARALKATRFEAAERNTWIEVQVGEGRPHLVKRLCAAVGHPVLRLFRPAQAGVSVVGLSAGEVRPLTPEEVRRVEGIAAGEPLPPVELFLPPRRHGRSGEASADSEAPEEEGQPVAQPVPRATPGRQDRRPRRQEGASQGGGRPPAAQGAVRHRNGKRPFRGAPGDRRAAGRGPEGGPRDRWTRGGKPRGEEQGSAGAGPRGSPGPRGRSDSGRRGAGSDWKHGGGDVRDTARRRPRPWDRPGGPDRRGTNVRADRPRTAGAWKRGAGDEVEEHRPAGRPWNRPAGERPGRGGAGKFSGRPSRPARDAAAARGGRLGARPARGKFGIPRSGPARPFSQGRGERPPGPGGRPGGSPRHPPRGSHAGGRGTWPGAGGGGAGGRGRGGGTRRR